MTESDLIDQPKALRDEDRFDVEAVDAWLKERIDGLSGEPEVCQFSRGASNLTYLLRYPDRDLILRRPPPGTKAKSAHNMVREHAGATRMRTPACSPCVTARLWCATCAAPFRLSRRSASARNS